MNSNSCVTLHEEKKTLVIDVNLPGHDARTTTSLFLRTSKELSEREGGRCFVCSRTEEECGSPLEHHHWLIERCLTDGVDWGFFREYVFRLERLLKYAADYVREHETLENVMDFVDDQTVNGMLLCREHHTADGKDIPCGIHTLEYVLWQFQCYGKEGFQFTKTETIDHADEHTVAVCAEKEPA